MKQLFLILVLVVAAGRLEAQNIAKNDPITKEITLNSGISSVVEYPGYHVRCQQAKKNFAFDVFSPKSGKAEVKVVNTSGVDICTIHKGALHEGKNSFILPSQKISKGIYYVVSKLESGEQFADRVVIDK